MFLQESADKQHEIKINKTSKDVARLVKTLGKLHERLVTAIEILNKCFAIQVHFSKSI